LFLDIENNSPACWFKEYDAFADISFSLSLYDELLQKKDRVGDVYRGRLFHRETGRANIHLGLVQTGRRDAFATLVRRRIFGRGRRQRIRVAVGIRVRVRDAKREPESDCVRGRYGWVDEEDGRDGDDSRETTTERDEREYYYYYYYYYY
jgi:hypothetical protein